MPFLFKLARRVARLRAHTLLAAAAAFIGACVGELASPATGGTPPVAIVLSARDAGPGQSVSILLQTTEPLEAFQATVTFDPQRLRYEGQGDGPDMVVVNDEAAAQGTMQILATNPQGLAPTSVTLVFTVTARGYADGVRGTLDLAVGPEDRVIASGDMGAAIIRAGLVVPTPVQPHRTASTSPTGIAVAALDRPNPGVSADQAGPYRFGDVTLDGVINVRDVLRLLRVAQGMETLGTGAGVDRFRLGNVRPANGGASATGVPPTCDPATTCRPGVTLADTLNPQGRIDYADGMAVARVAVGFLEPVVGEWAPEITPEARVASVVVAPASRGLRVGQTVQLTATPKDSAGNPLTGRAVAWTSSVTSVATVDGSGQVTGIAAGSATITATSEGKSGTAAVTVTIVPVASVQVSPDSAKLRVGQTVQLTATLKDSAGTALTGRPVAWTSSAPSVATVNATGQVTGVAAGSATITAASEGQSGSAAVTVTVVPLAAVQVTPDSAKLRVAQAVQLTATLRDSAGTVLTGRPVAWTSSAPSVATVTASGQVTGVAPGSVSITAASEGKSGSAAVTVTLAPVASVVLSPSPASLPLGGTVQLTATLKDASGNTLTGRPIAWASSAPAVATVSPSGLVTDVADGGTTTITAASEGQSGTAVVTVQAPSGSRADPTLLPVANMQLPNLVAYAALNVPSRPAGFSYNDPVTGVKVWKVTSSTMPAANSSAGHDYADGPNQVSLGWGPNANTHTILIRGDGMAYHFVDFTRGSGFSNYRHLPVQPNRDLRVSFSNLPSQPRIAYILTGSQVVRFNTATMQIENTGHFPLNQALEGWLQHDKNDEWFVGLQNGSTAFAWNSRTNQFLTHAESWLNEPRLERDGRYVVLSNTGNTIRLWDLATNTFGPTQFGGNAIWFAHNANLRGQWVTMNPNVSAPWKLERYYPSGGQVAQVTILNNSAGTNIMHFAGNWVQSDAELGGDLNKQWSFMSGTGSQFANLLLWREAVGVVRSDGSDTRLLLHHYDVNPTYWGIMFAMPSPDGKVVIFNSNMGGSGRYDLFIAEMPLR